MESRREATRIMMGVNESSIKGYPHPSISSRSAFDWTVDKIVRDNAAGFKISFLHVQIPDEDGFDDMDSIYASPEDFHRVEKRDKIRGLHLLEYFVGRCHQFGIACEAWIKRGDPKEVICSEVKRVHPDLLVVGSRGLGPFQSCTKAMLHVTFGVSMTGRLAGPASTEAADNAGDDSNDGNHGQNNKDRGSLLMASLALNAGRQPKAEEEMALLVACEMSYALCGRGFLW